MKNKKLTVKQRNLVKGVVEGKTMAQAAKDAGYSGSKETARVEGYRTLQKPHVSEALEKALNESGASLEKSAQIIADAHNAKRGKEKDHAMRLKAAELNLKARRFFNSSETQNNVQVNLHNYFDRLREEAERRGLLSCE